MSKAATSRSDDAIPIVITRSISFRFDGGIGVPTPGPRPRRKKVGFCAGTARSAGLDGVGSMERALQVKHNLYGMQGPFATVVVATKASERALRRQFGHSLRMRTGRRFQRAEARSGCAHRTPRDILSSREYAARAARLLRKVLA